MGKRSRKHFVPWVMKLLLLDSCRIEHTYTHTHRTDHQLSLSFLGVDVSLPVFVVHHFLFRLHAGGRGTRSFWLDGDEGLGQAGELRAGARELPPGSGYITLVQV